MNEVDVLEACLDGAGLHVFFKAYPEVVFFSDVGFSQSNLPAV